MRQSDDDGQLRILEVNARYWTSLLGSLMMGVNFPHLACFAALDVPFPAPNYSHSHYYELGTALRRHLGRHRSRGDRPHLLNETALRYKLTDPLAETVHAVRETHLWKLLHLRVNAEERARMVKTLKRTLRI
ncbi:MAG: ATP-grasp domain-containing protein [Actinomycetota bacterium]|jgi:hypothetical protein|nr:hypothetical protein [Rubrobacter sp.]MDQ3509281.1 ATP-grasp domain-containing protein [Actinomycetota bacterium]